MAMESYRLQPIVDRYAALSCQVNHRDNLRLLKKGHYHALNAINLTYNPCLSIQNSLRIHIYGPYDQ